METKFKLKIPFMKKSAAAKRSAAVHRLRFGKDPYFDWTVILAACIATTVLCVSFAYALWNTVSSGTFDSAGASSSGTEVSGPSLNAAGLQKALSIEDEKASNASEYEHGYSGPSDPSL